VVFTTRSSSCRTARRPATWKVGNRLRDVTREKCGRADALRCLSFPTIARITEYLACGEVREMAARRSKEFFGLKNRAPRSIVSRSAESPRTERALAFPARFVIQPIITKTFPLPEGNDPK
jgi:hypothetical protein